MTCPSCGAVVEPGARFCSACGHSLATRGDERRVATVLFADVVGFTSMSERRDPEQVKNLVDSCFERLVDDIDQFGGKVDKIIGDAILALFGAPVAHEDDAERAVRAALRMQQTVAQHREAREAGVQLRIGVNTGEVLVGSLRAGGDYTAMGDAVNIAQRLQAAAEPGTVVVGPATYAATRSVIDYRALGQLAAKGRDELVETWEARAALLPPGYRPRTVQTPFVGRDAELGILAHGVDAAAGRRRAHLLLLLGEAGVGKTRLAEEVAERARHEHRAVVYEGRCVPYGEANVWWPVAEALRHACRIATDDPLHTATELAATSVVGATGLPASSAEATRIVDGLLYLMGYEGPLREIDAQRAREEASRSVLAFLEGSARSRPVVLVVSDLHWADTVVLDLLDALLDRLSRAPVVVVATARHELHDRWRVTAGRHNQVVLNLDPLDRTSTGRLLDALAEAEMAPELRDALLDRSGGNPFYLEELVALVAGSEGSRPDLLGAPEPPVELPDTLRGLVAARIDGLSPEERATLEDAAVWGRSGPVVALERMCAEIRGAALGGVLTGLVDKEILVVEGDRWSFRSDLIREVAYNTLTKADRARRHHGIAAYLEKTGPDRREASERAVDVIAHHFAAAAIIVAELGDVHPIPATVAESALDWLTEAARRAEVSQVLPVARRLFGQALDLLGEHGGPRDDPARRVELLLGRARADAELRALDAARADVDAALALAGELGDRAATAEALLVRGDVEQKGAEFGAAVATLDEAQRRFRELGQTQGVAEALRASGMAQLFAGDNDAAEECISAALEAYRSLGDRRGEAWALQNLAWISFIEGRPSQAESRLQASAALFTELGDRGGLGWAVGLLAFLRFHQGRYAEADELGSQVLVEARDRGDRWGFAMMLVLTASVRLWSGRAEAAIAPAAEAVEAFRAIDDRQTMMQAASVHGRSLVHAGRVAEGLEVLQAANDEGGGVTDVGLAAVAVAIGDPRLALDVLALLPGELGPKMNLGTVERAVARGLAELQLGAVDEALEILGRAAADDAEGASAYAQSALALAHAAAGRRADAEAMRDAVDAAPRATYLDRATARLAVELARAADGDLGAVEGLAELTVELDATDDRVARAVVGLAEALVLEHVGLPAAELARHDVDERLCELGIAADGWRALYRLVLSGDQEATQHPVG